MVDVSIVPDERLVPCGAKETILGAALREGIPFAHACGGRALCSTCRVLVVDGRSGCTPRTTKERAIADRLGFGDEFRLACQTSVTAEVTIRRLVLDNEDVELADLRGRPGRVRGPRRRRAPTTDAAPIGTGARPLGEELPVAVLFADIRGFTPFSQAVLPYDVIHELQRHLQSVTRAVERQGGVVTSYMGDGVMALFLPGDGSPPSVRAARAGVEMLANAERRRDELEERYGRSFDVNVGLHHGPAIVGSLWGNPPTLTAIGDTVNLAARVEQANKDLATRFLTTEQTTSELGDAVVIGRRFSRCLPGVTGELKLVEVLDAS
ncbi:MAG TPA: adenylate/guanylate cyclase domain-containing protein [Ilumatobacter sp.]|nr:adenylate/guanylate cyclase domain-containing protein [Ilumatobacter sp.]